MKCIYYTIAYVFFYIVAHTVHLHPLLNGLASLGDNKRRIWYETLPATRQVMDVIVL